MKAGTDLRIIKTQTALVSAILELLKQKPFEVITVQEICELAMVRRATFYTHFADKYELLTFTIRTLYTRFKDAQSGIKTKERAHFYFSLIDETIDFLIENSALIYSLLQSELSSFLITIIANEITSVLTPELQKDLKAIDHSIAPQLITHYHIQGFLGAFIWWLQEGQHLSRTDFTHYIRTQISGFPFN